MSPIAQAVLWEVQVEQQGYCGNSYERLITLPPGEQAFEIFRNLARDAQYEVDFTTMIWDENVGFGDGPGRMFLNGIKELYDSVQDPVGHGKSAEYYSEGVKVRILVGLMVYPLEKFGPDRLQDQRVRIMEDIIAKGIGFTGTDWELEVAVYRNGLGQGIHSHAKLMIIDGKTIVTGGYNMQYAYLNGGTRRDMGVEVNGPIAFNALDAFDELWAGSYICTQVDGLNCSQNSVATLTRHEDLNTPPSLVGNDVVFSLFRTSDVNRKSSDAAIAAAIEAASNNVKIFQKSFMDTSLWNPPQYARALLNVLQKTDAQVNVKLLVSGGSPEDILVNIPGVCMLEAQLINEDPSRLYLLEARRSTSANPVHTKALSIDDTFLIVGSQNFDMSAWGNDPTDWPWGDLVEYSLGIDSSAAAATFNYGMVPGETDGTFYNEWNASKSVSCVNPLILSLQEVIDQALPGTAVFISSGVYTESVTINKPLVLVGAGASQSVFQPEGSGPAFRITSSDVVIANMKISGSNGYGIELIDSSPSSLENIQITRVVFENNVQGGVLAQGLIPGSPTNYSIENNTFIGGADGVTINMLETQTATSFIRDTIFSGQSNAPVNILSSDDSRVEYSYNLFDDCGPGSCDTNWIQGNLSTVSSAHDNLFGLDPLFASPANGAYQLSTDSPAIDAGDPELLHDLLYDGDNDGFVRIDIGAFEFAPVANVAPVVDAGVDQTIELGNPIAFTATYADADNTENHTARIDWGDGAVEDVAVTMTGPGGGEVTGEHTYSNAGNYTVEVCVIDLYGAVGCDSMNVGVMITPTSTPSPTPTPTNTPANTPTNTPTYTPTSTPTPTFTPTSTPTATATQAPAFPSTGILDNFNRANGSIGSNWSGNSAGYDIQSNKLHVKSKNPNLDIYWNNTLFGPNQEVYFTFSTTSATAADQDLILKAQSTSGWGAGFIEVWYDAVGQRVQVWTFDQTQSWIQHGADIPVTFVNGDQFGARARADGTVEVYRNGALLGTRNVST